MRLKFLVKEPSFYKRFFFSDLHDRHAESDHLQCESGRQRHDRFL